MAVELRNIVDGERAAFERSVHIPFLQPPWNDSDVEEDIAFEADRLEVDRAWVGEERGRFVSNCCVYTMDLTVPSAPGRECPVIGMGGVSAVGVHPTHRRRGLLTAMMAEMLDDCRRRGEPVAGLVASESVIYGRFGFGHATDRINLTISSHASDFASSLPEIELQLVDDQEAAKLLPPLHDRARRRRPGDPNRDDGHWRHLLKDPPRRREGGHGRFYAVADGGYVAYRAHESGRLDEEKATVVIEDMVALTPEVEAGLWRFVLDLDLVGQIKARRRPVDEPIRWRLSDPRQLRVEHQTDFLHLRVLDVPAALEARGYRSSGRITFELLGAPATVGSDDPAVGTWTLEAGPDGASCQPAGGGASPDLRMEVTDLGSLFLGGFKPSVLAAGGRIDELTPGALDLADRLFASPLAPLTSTGF